MHILFLLEEHRLFNVVIFRQFQLQYGDWYSKMLVSRDLDPDTIIYISEK